MRFAPKLPVESIKQEAVRVVVRKAEERAQKEYDEKIRKEKEEAEAQSVSKLSRHSFIACQLFCSPFYCLQLECENKYIFDTQSYVRTNYAAPLQ